jgi:hypothetical protein
MDNAQKLETQKALLLALATALTALGWSALLDREALAFGHLLLRIPGVPNFRTPEVRFSGAPSSPDVRFVWNGYAAKKPETMAARIATELKAASDRQKEAEAKRTFPIYVTAAERSLLETALRVRRGTLSDYLSAPDVSVESKSALSAEVEAIGALLANLAVTL